MSAVEPKRNQPKQKQRDPKPKALAHGTERLKTVVRRLPPNLPEEIFWQSVQTWVTDDSVTWKVYHAGKLRKRCVSAFVCAFFGVVNQCRAVAGRTRRMSRRGRISHLSMRSFLRRSVANMMAISLGIRQVCVVEYRCISAVG